MLGGKGKLCFHSEAPIEMDAVVHCIVFKLIQRFVWNNFALADQ